MLFDLPSLETPFRYFGAKTKARKILAEFVPPSVREIVSPFIGGGAFELWLTGRGIRVHASDAFPPLVNLWQVLLDSPKELGAEIRDIVSGLWWQDWTETAAEFKAQASGSRVTDAAHCLLLYNLTFNNVGPRKPQGYRFFIDEEGVPRRDQEGFRNRQLVFYERIEGFSNPLLSVECLDFREALAKHPDTFAYLDPPYPAATAAYGDSPKYHEDFDHEGLAEILTARKKWVLSYNEDKLVKDLYPESQFRWTRVSWAQCRISHGSVGHEVIITPHGEPHAERSKI